MKIDSYRILSTRTSLLQLRMPNVSNWKIVVCAPRENDIDFSVSRQYIPVTESSFRHDPSEIQAAQLLLEITFSTFQSPLEKNTVWNLLLKR